MNARQLHRFAREFLLPELPGFVAWKNCLCRTPIGPILKAYLFDSSAFCAAKFYPQAFVQPLYLPHEHLVLNFGERFRGVWRFDKSALQPLADRLLKSMKQVGSHLFDRLGTPEGLAGYHPKSSPPANLHQRQAVAYSMAYVGQDGKALEELEELVFELGRVRDRSAWVPTLLAQVSQFKNTLIQDPEEARMLLRRWTEQTRQRLGLPA